MENYFADHVYRLGIVGDPNRGKTTLAYTYYDLLNKFSFPARYYDLDIYSPSGKAIAGTISWDERKKEPNVSEKAVVSSINCLKKIQGGLVVVDFPGRRDNPYTPE